MPSSITIDIPELSLVLLVGSCQATRTQFASTHFALPNVLSLKETGATNATPFATDMRWLDTQEALEEEIRIRLKAARRVIVNATQLDPGARNTLRRIARASGVQVACIVLPPTTTHTSHEIQKQLQTLRQERYRSRTFLAQPLTDVRIRFTRMPCDRREESGPFDIIGDIHGCADELHRLIAKLGYEYRGATYRHPHGRKIIFLGDYVDRGPNAPEVIRVVQSMIEASQAFALLGNHEERLMRCLLGHRVMPGHGLSETMDQLSREPNTFRNNVMEFIKRLGTHYTLDRGRLVVAHAGLPESLQGRCSGKERAFALYGPNTGKVDAQGFPERIAWAKDYRGDALVVYGHTPVRELFWANNTVCIDTGCVFGGQLTAMQYPERTFVQETAKRTYWDPHTS